MATMYIVLVVTIATLFKTNSLLFVNAIPLLRGSRYSIPPPRLLETGENRPLALRGHVTNASFKQ